MSDQAHLFEPIGRRIVNVETPAARTTDPGTSHEAAEKITDRGERGRQQRAVLDLIRANPGRTAGELAEISSPWRVDYFAIQRRVSEVEPQFVRRGEKRVCSVRGTKQTTLWPKGGSA